MNLVLLGALWIVFALSCYIDAFRETNQEHDYETD